MGKGSIKFPEPSAEEKAYFAFMTSHAQKVQAQEEAERTAEQTRMTGLRNTGISGYEGHKQNILNQYTSGLIDYNTAKKGLEDYRTQYSLDKDETQNTKIQTDLNTLEGEETTKAPQRNLLLAGQAYKDVLGREATAEELTKFTNLQKDAGYKLSDLASSLKGSDEYNKKFNKSYLDNYLDTMYGAKTTETDEKGLARDVRTFKYGSEYDPTYAGDLKNATNIELAKGPSSFTGTTKEIEDFQARMRQNRDFMFNAGLTNLQGQIDKDTQKIKNEGSKEVARIGTQGQLLSNLTAGFWS